MSRIWELAEKRALERSNRWPKLEITIRGTSAGTHTLTPPWLQQQVHELVDGVLREELECLRGHDESGVERLLLRLDRVY